MIEGSLIHLAGLHALAGLNDSVGGLVEEEIHILRVGAGGILALAAIGDADVFRKLDEEGIPETLRVDAAVAMSSKNVDGNYILALELFCNAVADLLDVLARDVEKTTLPRPSSTTTVRTFMSSSTVSTVFDGKF